MGGFVAPFRRMIQDTIKARLLAVQSFASPTVVSPLSTQSSPRTTPTTFWRTMSSGSGIPPKATRTAREYYGYGWVRPAPGWLRFVSHPTCFWTDDHGIPYPCRRALLCVDPPTISITRPRRLVSPMIPSTTFLCTRPNERSSVDPSNFFHLSFFLPPPPLVFLEVLSERFSSFPSSQGAPTAQKRCCSSVHQLFSVCVDKTIFFPTRYSKGFITAKRVSSSFRLPEFFLPIIKRWAARTLPQPPILLSILLLYVSSFRWFCFRHQLRRVIFSGVEG